MITIEKLMKELKKFPKDAVCYAYEGGKVTGLIIEIPNKILGKQGVIFCSEGDDSNKTTKLLEE